MYCGDNLVTPFGLGLLYVDGKIHAIQRQKNPGHFRGKIGNATQISLRLGLRLVIDAISCMRCCYVQNKRYSDVE